LPEQQKSFALTDDEILRLAEWTIKIENHYSHKRDKLTPMDIEWARDGLTGELYVVQARPETVHSGKKHDILEIYKLKAKGKIATTGAAIGGKIAVGPVRIIRTLEELRGIKKGEILVADKTDPDWEPSMKTASGVITNHGGRTCHAAIVSRELGLAAVVGTRNGTEVLKDGQVVTLSCAEGDVGKVYDGELPFDIERVILGDLDVKSTEVMLNVANPEEAMRLSFLPNDGVGLARIEFIINNYIKIHPLALLDYPKLEKFRDKVAIEELTQGYADKAQFFVDKLAEGVGMIGGAFYPKPVIVRFSDFKTNEYAHLVGGESYEPKEENPMIGFRGASRYYSERYRRAFALECCALRKVRCEFGLSNVKVMIPFCRTIDEGKRVLQEMEKNGLKRGDDGLEVYVMCEIPSNVVLAEDFADIFDGFSIGSNDLTQLTLGIDRDSEILSDLFDERNEAVKRLIAQVIAVAKKKHKKIGICGQAPSDYPEFADFLVKAGIDSISLSADAIVGTRRMLREREKQLQQGFY
jgi:pyruvate,water dikinase